MRYTTHDLKQGDSTCSSRDVNTRNPDVSRPVKHDPYSYVIFKVGYAILYVYVLQPLSNSGKGLLYDIGTEGK